MMEAKNGKNDTKLWLKLVAGAGGRKEKHPYLNWTDQHVIATCSSEKFIFPISLSMAVCFILRIIT